MTTKQQQLRRIAELEQAAQRNKDQVDGSVLVFDWSDEHRRRWRGFDAAQVAEALRPEVRDGK